MAGKIDDESIHALRCADAAIFLAALFGPYGGSSVSRASKVVKWGIALNDSHGDIFWDVVLKSWSSFDLIPHADFEALFNRFDQSAPPQTHFPERQKLFRGQNSLIPDGLSWTTNLKVATEFALGHRGVRHATPCILEITVERESVAFACSDREEDEIVLKHVPSAFAVRAKSLSACR